MEEQEEAFDCYICLECSYVYDPVKGDPKGGIPPGTPFTKLPLTWKCPECGIFITKKGVFKKIRRANQENQGSAPSPGT